MMFLRSGFCKECGRDLTAPPAEQPVQQPPSLHTIGDTAARIEDIDALDAWIAEDGTIALCEPGDDLCGTPGCDRHGCIADKLRRLRAWVVCAEVDAAPPPAEQAAGTREDDAECSSLVGKMVKEITAIRDPDFDCPRDLCCPCAAACLYPVECSAAAPPPAAPAHDALVKRLRDWQVVKRFIAADLCGEAADAIERYGQTMAGMIETIDEWRVNSDRHRDRADDKARATLSDEQ